MQIKMDVSNLKNARKEIREKAGGRRPRRRFNRAMREAVPRIERRQEKRGVKRILRQSKK